MRYAFIISCAEIRIIRGFEDGYLLNADGRFFSLEGKIRVVFVACDLRKESSERTGIEMMTLEEMKAVDIRTVDPDTLVDIRDVHIDRTLPKEERIKSFIRQIKNPYVYKCGDIIVKATFSDTDETLEDRMEHYLRNR